MADDARQVGSFFTNATQDDSIDLNALLRQAKENRETAAKAESIPEPAPVEAPSEEVKEEKPLSPLQQMKAAGNNQLGMVVDTTELQKAEEAVNGPKKLITYSESRSNAIDDRISDFDNSIEKRKHVVMLANIQQGDPRWADLINEIDSLEMGPDGNWKYRDGVTPVFTRLRTAEDPEFGTVPDAQIVHGGATAASVEEEAKEETPEEGEAALTPEEQKKNEIVKILIDKTGFGANFDFTEEERSKMYEAQEIQLTEVELMDIPIATVPKSDMSFQELVKEHEMFGSKVTISFPCSGFRAQMKGLTYGEMSDIALDMEAVTFDKYYKRLSVIYNKMTNISTGPFKNFETFLKSFAYIDIPMAVYGLFVASQPEVQQIQLRCQVADCEKSFSHKYNTRSIIRLEDCSDKYLEKMKEVTTANPADYDKIKADAPVNQSKFVKMPRSGFIFEIGIISAYDFLYNFIPLMDEEEFRDAFGDDPNDFFASNLLFLMGLRSVLVSVDGKYQRLYGYKNILEALYNIDPEEIRIIQSIVRKIIAEYQASFGLKNVVCPHCGHVTESLPLNIDDVVFQTHQTLMSTEINVENIRGL